MTEKIIAGHTPGPWQTLTEECDKPYIRVRGSSLGYRYKIANVLNPAYDGAHLREVEETRANARLIAAAPALLSACQLQHAAIDMLMAMLIEAKPGFMPTKSPVWPTVIAGSAAIAKATAP